MKIAVIAHHGLGDLLMAVPLLRRCDAVADEDRGLTVVVKSRIEADLLKTIPWKTQLEILALERNFQWSDLFRLYEVSRIIRARKIDLLLLPHGTDSLSLSLWSRSFGAVRSVGPAGPFAFIGYDKGVSRRLGEHKTPYFERYAVEGGLGENPGESDITIPLSDAARNHANSRFPGEASRKWVVLAPGSGIKESHKRWPPENFIELGNILFRHSTDFGLVLFGSTEEKDLLESIAKGIGGNDERILVTMEKDIGNALAVLGRCACMVAGCSGAAHMAASVGIPIVGIFGPTNPGFTGPYSKRLRLVRRGLACSPCYRPGFILGCGNNICMKDVAPDDVVREIENVLRGVPYPPIPWFPTTNAKKPSSA